MDFSVGTYLRQLEESGYINRLREFGMARYAPFFWSSQEPDQPPKLLHNGTITYVGTGQRDLGMTNAHVYDQYLKDRAGPAGCRSPVRRLDDLP